MAMFYMDKRVSSQRMVVASPNWNISSHMLCKDSIYHLVVKYVCEAWTATRV